MRNTKPILLVEDDAVDIMTIKRSFEEIHVSNTIHVAGNGEEALALLNNPQNELPCVILLDLTMPKMGGIEFLKIVKSNEQLKQIPVIVLTTSRNTQDKMSSFELNAAGYIVKPADYQHFVEAIKIINQYWTLSEIPNRN